MKQWVKPVFALILLLTLREFVSFRNQSLCISLLGNAPLHVPVDDDPSNSSSIANMSDVDPSAKATLSKTATFFDKMPESEYLFNLNTLTDEVINSTLEYVKHKARPAIDVCNITENRIYYLHPEYWQGDCGWYYADYLQLMKRLPVEYHNVRILLFEGDLTVYPPDAVIIAKNRPIGDPKRRTVTVLPICNDRHFGYELTAALQDPLLFHEKTPRAYWRGSTTSNCWERGLTPSGNEPKCARWNLVVRWAPSNSSLVDVSLSNFVQGVSEEVYGPFRKEWIHVDEWLKCRYVISVEGNDVATNLKWALASNSVVLMPPPTYESIVLESKLIPWVHYVPLQYDTSDLEEKILLCEANLTFCQAIAEEGRRWATGLAERNTMMDFGAKILKRHIDILVSKGAYLMNYSNESETTEV